MFNCSLEESKGENCRAEEWWYPWVTASASPHNSPIFWRSRIAYAHWGLLVFLFASEQAQMIVWQGSTGAAPWYSSFIATILKNLSEDFTRNPYSRALFQAKELLAKAVLCNLLRFDPDVLRLWLSSIEERLWTPQSCCFVHFLIQSGSFQVGPSEAESLPERSVLPTCSFRTVLSTSARPATSTAPSLRLPTWTFSVSTLLAFLVYPKRSNWSVPFSWLNASE